MDMHRVQQRIAPTMEALTSGDSASIRRLVQAGITSIPAVSAAVRLHGGQVMMAQAHGDLPEGLRDALGDRPEVRGMKVTSRVGAGMSEHPKHHVMPDEHRGWFEERGFKGDMDIDPFCVRLERAHHEGFTAVETGSWGACALAR